MKAVFVLWHGSLGGAETLTRQVVRHLTRDCGVDAHVVFLKSDGRLGGMLSADGTHWDELGVSNALALATSRTLTGYLGLIGADVVVLPGYGAFGRDFMRQFGDRAVVVEHGGLNPWSLPAHRRLAWPLLRYLGSRKVAVEVAVSRYMVAVQATWPHAPITLIVNAVDTDAFAPLTEVGCREGMVLGAAGRLIRGKGFDCLVDAFALACAQRGDLRLRIAGSGPEREALWAQVTRLGMEGVVELVGPVDDMPRFWNSVDVGVVPSAEFVETFGMTSVEIQACGRPAIVTDRGGLAETVDVAIGGRVVRAADVHSLAEALVSYSPEVAAQEGRRARERARSQYGIARAAAEYADLLRRVEALHVSGGVGVQSTSWSAR